MSRGLGRVQRALLAILRDEEEDYQRAGNRDRRAPLLDTITLACDVYQVEPDEHNERLVSDAQVVAVQRALAGLVKKGLLWAAPRVSRRPCPMGDAERHRPT